MKTILILFFTFCCVCYAQAQSIDKQVVASAGETLSNSTNQLITTIGEPIIGLKGSTVSVNQGFLAGLSSGTLSIEESIISKKIKLYPNPVKDMLNISILDNQEKVQATIYSMTGQQVLVQDMNTALQTIDMSNLSNGIYLVRLVFTNSNTIKTFKISKK